MPTNSHIKVTLLLLQSQLNAPIVYDRTNDRFLMVGNENDHPIYYDLDDEQGTVYFDLNPDQLISAPTLPAIRTALNGDKRTLNGTQTATQRHTNVKTNGHQTQKNGVQTEKKQPVIEKLTGKKRRETAKFYHLSDFSKDYTGYTKEVSEKIFMLTIEILAHTSTQSVIDEVLKLFEKARTHAQSGQPTDINELNKIKKTLQTKRNRQKGIAKGVQNFTAKKQKLLRLKIIAFVVILLFAVYFFNHKNADPTPPTTQTIELTAGNIDDFINAYEQTHNIKVYAWRREQITNVLAGKNVAPAELDSLLNYYINKAWKN